MLFYSESYLKRNTLNHFIPEPGMAESLFSLYALITNGLLIGFWVLIAWWLYTFARSKNRWLALIGILLICTIAGLFGYHKYTKYRAKKDYQEAKAAAEAHFSEVCKKAGTFFYETIPPQDGVLIMKPVQKEATYLELRDQYWKGDPYGHSGGSFDYNPLGLLSDGYNLPDTEKENYFLFVESVDIDDPTKLWRYTVTSPLPNSGSVQLVKERVTAIKSHYGTTWDDISTTEDRDHWIACGRRQLINLKENKVVAEHIGCKFDSWLGLQPYGSRKPWSDSRGGTCPAVDFPGADWLRNTLRPLSFKNSKLKKSEKGS